MSNWAIRHVLKDILVAIGAIRYDSGSCVVTGGPLGESGVGVASSTFKKRTH